MRAFLDQINGDRAELRLGPDEKQRLVVPLACLPAGVREGEVLQMSFSRDPEATASETAANDRLRDRLLERSEHEPL